MNAPSVDGRIRDELEEIARLQARGLSRYDALHRYELESMALATTPDERLSLDARARCGGAWASGGARPEVGRSRRSAARFA